MSKKSIAIILILIGFVLALFYISSSFTTKPTNWEQKYGASNKNPFGYYVLYQELKTITNAKSINEITSLNEISKLNPKNDVVFFIEENINYQHNIYDSIKPFVNKGGIAFLSETSSNNHQTNQFKTNDSIIQKINQFRFNSNYNKYTNTAKYFTKSNQKQTIANVTTQLKTKANYLKVNDKKGIYYIHADPNLFTNLYLLTPNGYRYAKEVFKPFHEKNIYWINPSKYYANSDNASPLSFILSQPELRTAWYLILICLILFLIFKSKREQKIIKIIEPEQNLSLEFANVIASMYYESGKPIDIIKKKIDYFFYTIRKQYNLTTENIFDEHFIYVIAQKAQITTQEATEFITQLHTLHNNQNATLKDVTKTYNIINDYKTKAQIT